MSENKTLREIHTNEVVQVKLTDLGVEIFREQVRPVPPDRVVKMMLWDLMATFGPCIGMGKPLPFEGTFHVIADTPSVQSAPDTVRRQEAIREIEKALAWIEKNGPGATHSISTKSMNTALSALKDKVLIPYIGEVSGEPRFETCMDRARRHNEGEG